MTSTEIFHAPGGRILADPETATFVEAFAVNGDRVMAAGPLAGMKGLYPRGRIVPLDGALVLPGLCDAHVHLMFTAARMNGLELDSTLSFDRILDRLGEFSVSRQRNSRILGFGFGSRAIEGAEAFPGGAAAIAKALESASGGRPVFLISNDAHTVLTSSCCGGDKPGLLRETVFSDYDAFWPPEERAASLDLSGAEKRFHSEGITWIHNFEGPPEHLSLLERASTGQLGLRVFSYFTHQTGNGALKIPPRDEAPQASHPEGSRLVTMAGIKCFSDGSLGSMTAAMDEPYLSEDGSAGMLLLGKNDIAGLAARAIDAGFPLAVHAIGDRAFREVLTGLGSIGPHHDGIMEITGCHRIEHAQTLPADMRDLMSEPRGPGTLPLVSIQPVHMPLDFADARKRLGDGFRRCFAFGSLLRWGFKLMVSSDSPVARPDFAEAFRGAVLRMTPSGPWSPEEGISPLDFVRAMTVWPAIAVGALGEVGIIAPGSRADFVVLNEDVLEGKAESPEISFRPAGNRNSPVSQTWFGGLLVHER